VPPPPHAPPAVAHGIATYGGRHTLGIWGARLPRRFANRANRHDVDAPELLVTHMTYVTGDRSDRRSRHMSVHTRLADRYRRRKQLPRCPGCRRQRRGHTKWRAHISGCPRCRPPRVGPAFSPLARNRCCGPLRVSYTRSPPRSPPRTNTRRIRWGPLAARPTVTARRTPHQRTQPRPHHRSTFAFPTEARRSGRRGGSGAKGYGNEAHGIWKAAPRASASGVTHEAVAALVATKPVAQDAETNGEEDRGGLSAATRGHSGGDNGRHNGGGYGPRRRHGHPSSRTGRQAGGGDGRERGGGYHAVSADTTMGAGGVAVEWSEVASGDSAWRSHTGRRCSARGTGLS